MAGTDTKVTSSAGEGAHIWGGASNLEDLLRVELIDCMPKDISDKRPQYASQTSNGILARAMGE
eukprot:12931740-Prorocentrum_lima.AAC.1